MANLGIGTEWKMWAMARYAAEMEVGKGAEH
jgi:hypothetical protein